MSTGTDLAAELDAIIGKNDETQAPTGFLDTGFPPLNKAISGKYDGGLPCGRLIEMFGPPSAGKTAIATRAMIAAQQAGGVAAFFDHERSFDARLAANMGLDLDKRWVFKTPETFEQSTTMAIKMALTVRKHLDRDKPIICVFDSLAAMVPQSKMAKDVDEYNMNDNTALARATSAVFPALAQHCEKHNFTALFLNQSRTKIGVMFGDPTTTPGGESPKFYASVRIKLGANKIAKGKGADREVLGMQIGAECVKNKISRPFEKAKWNFMFRKDGTGHFDVEGSLIDYLAETGRLEESKGRVTWTDGKSYFRGKLIGKIVTEGRQAELMALLGEPS